MFIHYYIVICADVHYSKLLKRIGILRCRCRNVYFENKIEALWNSCKVDKEIMCCIWYRWTANYMLLWRNSLLKPKWSTLIKHLIDREMLRFVCTDEVHLFVQFAITFQLSYLHLKSILFDRMLKTRSNSTTSQTICDSTIVNTPAIFMTVTFNKQLFKLLQKITGFKFSTKSIFWADCHHFSRRNINIDVSVTVQQLHI